MRTASTTARTENIIQALKGSNLKAHSKIEWDNSGTWTPIYDIDGKPNITINASAKRFKYANFNLTPLSSSIKFIVQNKDGEYSEGSGQAEESILINNRKIKASLGYKVKGDPQTFSAGLDLTDLTKTTKFYTKVDGTGIKVDETNAIATVDSRFTDLFTLYDSTTYDSDFYTPCGYMVYRRDRLGNEYENLTSITVNANSTLITVYWREFNNTDEAAQQNTVTFWTNAGRTSVGDKTRGYKEICRVSVRIYKSIMG
jgi:hypothetical protein